MLDQLILSTMFRKPKRRQHTQRQSSDSPSVAPSRSVSPSKPSTHLISPSEVSRIRRPRHSQNLFLPGPECLFTLPGEDFTQEASPSRGRMSCSDSGNLAPPQSSPFSAVDPGPMDDIFVTHNTDSDDLRRQRQRLKTQKQWVRWTDEVIPSLVHPYLRFLKVSESMRSICLLENTICSCNSGVHHLKIVCVYLESKSTISGA